MRHWTIPSSAKALLGAQLAQPVEVQKPFPAGLDRQLGYFGHARYVFMYFDVRADGLLWDDGQGAGFGSGSWRTYSDYVEPLAIEYGVALTGHRSRGMVFLIDRQMQKSWFLPWHLAASVVASQYAVLRPSPAAEAQRIAPAVWAA